MDFRIAVLPGDGIGPEVIAEAKKVLNAVGDVYNHHFDFREALAGADSIDKTGNPMPDETLKLCKSSDAVLFGAIGDPKYDDNPDAKVRPEQGLLKLRKTLGLFANIRPIRAYDALIEKSPLKKNIIEGVDFEIYRELTGGLYFGEKKLSKDGSRASDLCQYHISEIERIGKLAFERAKKRNNRLTLVDKANVLESSRLWRRVITCMGKDYPDVALDFLFVDNAAMQMILNPRRFDVILTENMFGDIISDEGSVIGGSIGLLASASIGDDVAMFEPIHGSYPQAKGKNTANPIACILSAALMLSHFDLHRESVSVQKAVEQSLSENYLTADLTKDNHKNTTEVGTYIADKIHIF